VRQLLAAMVAAFILLIASVPAGNAEAGIDGATNAYRQSLGLPAIAGSGTLTEFAQQRAQQIYSPTTGANFYHQYWWWGPSGCNGIGENIVYRIPAADNPADYAVTAWIQSEPHRQNMIGDWDIMGSATYIAPDGGQYSVQLFGEDCGGSTPAPTPAPAAPQPVSKAPQALAATPEPQPVMLPDTALPAP